MIIFYGDIDISIFEHVNTSGRVIDYLLEFAIFFEYESENLKL